MTKRKKYQKLSSSNRWTDEEINELLKLIEKNPYNFSRAYRIHALANNRTPAAVKWFFQKYRKNENVKTCMLTIGKRSYSINRKNIYQGTGGTVNTNKVSKWRRILNIIFE